MTGQVPLLLLPEIVLLASAMLVFLLDSIWRGDERSDRWIPVLVIGGLVATFISVIALWPLTADGPLYLSFAFGESVPVMAFDRLALFFKLITTLTILIVGLMAIDYLKQRTPYRGEFFTLALLTGLSMTLVTSATNLILLYLSFEMLSITSYVLTGFLKRDVRSTEGAVKYFMYGAVASAVMLYGFTLLYGATGSVDLATIATGLAAGDASIRFLSLPALILILTGFGFKIALVPFHQWSPDAYEGAPTPITAFLSVGPKAAGFGVLIRFLIVAVPGLSTEWVAILAGIAIVTMTVGNLVALQQTNLKRLLAYSSIAQAGYMLIGIAAIAPTAQSWTNGLNAVLLYLFAYLFTNLGAFAVVIALENETKTANIVDYAGLIRRAPFLSVALFVFFLSLIGIPPTGGFVGKLFVFGAAIQQQMFLLAVVGIINSVISVYYYLAVVRKMFFAAAPEETPLKVSPVLSLVVAVCLIMVLAIALAASPFVTLATDSVQILGARFW